MNIKKYVFLVVLLPFVTNSASAVDLRQYVGIKFSNVLSGQIDLETDTVNDNCDLKEFFGGSVSYGVKLSDFRFELEGNLYSFADVKKAHDVKFQNTSIFVNTYYDFQTNSFFVPYLGLGLGFNRISADINDNSDAQATLGLKAGFGVAWAINHDFVLDIGYRYNYFGTYSEDNIDASLCGSEILLGGRVTF